MEAVRQLRRLLTIAEAHEKPVIEKFLRRAEIRLELLFLENEVEEATGS